MKCCDINSNKLRARLKELGVSIVDAGGAISKEVGLGPHYLTQALKNGRISRSASKVLFARYGIDPEDYVDGTGEHKAEPAAEDEEREAGQAEARTPEGLREIIREAALDAMVQALADEGMRKAVGDIIYNSVKGAIINSARLINQGGV